MNPSNENDDHRHRTPTAPMYFQTAGTQSMESSETNMIAMDPLSPTHSRHDDGANDMIPFPAFHHHSLPIENPFANFNRAFGSTLNDTNNFSNSSNNNNNHIQTEPLLQHQLEINTNPESSHSFRSGGRDSDSDSDSAPPNNLIVEERKPLVQKTNTRLKSAFRVQRENLRRGNQSSPRSNIRAESVHSEQQQQEQERQVLQDDDDEVEVDDRTRAFRIWAAIEDLDGFLERIYDYFVEKGFYAVLLSRFCNLFILAFMVGFSTFAFSCIDHSRIHKHKQLSDVIIPQCIKTLPGIQSFFLIIFGIWWLSQVFRLFLDLPHLYEIKLVYEHILEIKESDMDTVEWQEIVQKLSHLKYTHPNLNPERKPGLDSLNAHSIVNRIMRKDNYLIAMFNKEILNLRVPGVLGGWLFGKKGIVVTKILEWNLYFCVVLYAFDEKGALRRRFLKSNHRRRLVIGLQQRFELMGILNLLFSPFLLVIAILYSLFKYAEEYQKSPASLGARQYTLQAQWTLREFNELPHTFQTRLNRSYPLAVKYLDQFRKQKTILLARLISFIAGAFVAALAMLAILDQELTEFEITPGRSALFYITVFGGILAAVRGTIPDETRIFEPESHLKQVIEETHHLPESWRGKLHTEFVKNEFSALFDLKMKQLLLEVASLVLAPFILYYSMPHSAEAIIDFIRDCTVDMEGVGFVCSFAAFDLARYGNPKYGVPTLAMGGASSAGAGAGAGAGSSGDGNPRDLVSKEGKMEQSFLYFKANYPQWDVGVDGSQYLQALSRSTQRLAGANGLRSEASILLEGGAAGTGTVRSRRGVKFGGQLVPNQSSSNGGVRMLTESRLGLSEMERSGMDEEPVGLFGILDAVYEANNRARL